MKEIVEEVKREVIEKHVTYEAVDGTTWTNKQMCEEYENNMSVILLGKVKEFSINNSCNFDWFESSSEDIYDVVVPTEESHINILNQLYLLFGGKCANNVQLPVSSKDLNTIILVGHRICGSEVEWCWLWKFSSIIEQATNNKYKLVKND